MANAILEAHLDRWRGQNIAVLGLGVSNRPLVKLLLAAGCQVTGCDRTPRERLDSDVLALEGQGLTLRTGPDYLDGLTADVVFRTPGMHPAILAPLRQAGAEITSEMEIFFQCCPCPIIAVTGSDGKTTTATLIAEILKAAGYRVHLGGNIGKPLLPEIDAMRPEDRAVVELSSFQLMDMDRSAHTAVVTNVAPNHLDVHRDMAEYVAAKKNVFAHQGSGDLVVLNLDNAITRDFAREAPGQVSFFSRQAVPEQGVYLQNGIIYRTGPSGPVQVLEQGDIRLPGMHNVENYLAAIAAVAGQAPDEAIVQVARNFGGVEHRIELVREKDGVRYYNDSIASSPSRTIAGLRSFPEKVILIAGGYDKHIPYDVLGPEICRHVKRLIVTGATGEKIRQAVLAAPAYRPGCPEIISIADFDQAVHTAAEGAVAGDVVLLSPASAAFDRFANFTVRGRHFKELIQNL